MFSASNDPLPDRLSVSAEKFEVVFKKKWKVRLNDLEYKTKQTGAERWSQAKVLTKYYFKYV